MATRDVLRLLRPWQWYKNFIVFIPLVFSNNALSAALYLPATETFVAFCLLASGHYAWNDVRDRVADQAHPQKRMRPVASGAISVPTAVAVGVVLTLAGLLLMWRVNPATFAFGLGYVLFELLYTLWLKRVPILDVILIGIGFVLRALAGTTAIDVGEPTQWLILVTFLFALFLALAKRRHELLLMEGAEQAAETSRASLRGYSVAYTEQLTSLTAGLVLTAYFLYTFFGAPTTWMMLTIPFAVFGVFRYLLLLHRRDPRGEAEILLKDPGLVLSAALWLLTAILVLQDVAQQAFEWLESLAP